MAICDLYENAFHEVESEENKENEEKDEPEINIELHENPNIHVMNREDDQRNEVSLML